MNRFDSMVSNRQSLQPAHQRLRNRLRSSEEALIRKAGRKKRALHALRVEIDHRPGLCTVRLVGDMEGDDVQALTEALGENCEEAVWLDLSDLSFMDRGAFRAILRAKRERDQHGRALIVAGATGPVRRAFEVLGIGGVLSDSAASLPG